MAMLQSPSSSNSNGYDVFLSFRGPDTRYSFTGNLYKALCDRGIRTFIDDKELQRGYEITPSLVKAIEDSRILIPILSINYASSSFCLDELVCIIHCLVSKGRLVLPVFYGVEPSDIRHQTGVYGKDIAKHKKRFQSNKEKYTDNMERLLKWKAALTQTANLSGYHFNFRNEYEYEVIEKIVDDVSNKINRDRLHVGMMNDDDDDVKNDYDYDDDYDYNDEEYEYKYFVDYPVGQKSRLLKIFQSFLVSIIIYFFCFKKVFGKIVDEVSNKINRVLLYVVKGKFSLSVSLYHCYLLFLFGIFIVFITFY